MSTAAVSIVRPKRRKELKPALLGGTARAGRRSPLCVFLRCCLTVYSSYSFNCESSPKPENNAPVEIRPIHPNPLLLIPSGRSREAQRSELPESPEAEANAG